MTILPALAGKTRLPLSRAGQRSQAGRSYQDHCQACRIRNWASRSGLNDMIAAVTISSRFRTPLQ